MIDWLRTFPDADFRFRIGLSRSDGRSFFDPEPGRDERLDMRRRSLESHAERYAGAMPESEAAIDEAGGWMDPDVAIEPDASAFDRCVALGRAIDADWVLLSGDADRHHPVIAGCVCFPSHWSLPGKLGQPIEMVHRPVPTLAEKLDPAIHTFLERLKPGVGWERDNWGMAPDSRLDRHPEVPGGALDAGIRVANVWLRLERQYLVRLPETSSILFGIKVTTHPLAEIAALPGVGPRIARALRTMPDDIARYKGLEDCRRTLAGQIEESIS